MRSRLIMNILALLVVPVVLGGLVAWWTFVVLSNSSATGGYWFNGPVVRAGFMFLLVATIVGVIGGYIVRVVVPKYYGRPVSS